MWVMNRGLWLVTVVVGVSVPAFAGPMPPCIASALSANGQVLVTDTLGFDGPDQGHGQRIMASTYQVLRKDADPWLAGPNAYWTWPRWELSFQRGMKGPFHACDYVLVPDSGEFLIFAGSNLGPYALTIYHRSGVAPSSGPYQGELVREIPLAELWPSDPPRDILTDHTPQWFAGGTFTFSVDQKTLLYRDKDSRRVEVELATGEIRHKN